jgi:hypothetical protein
MGKEYGGRRQGDGGRTEMEGDLADRRMEREEVERGKGKGRGGMGDGGRERRKIRMGKG